MLHSISYSKNSFRVGNTATNTATPFGVNKPSFGQPTTGLFGTTAPAATGTSFGQPSAPSFGAGFGATAPATSQPSTLFGQPTNTGSALFGLTSSAPNSGFGGFGNTTNTAAGMCQFASSLIFIHKTIIDKTEIGLKFNEYSNLINL